MDSDFSTPYIVLPVADLVEGPREPAPFILSKKARIVEERKAGGASDKNQAPPLPHHKPSENNRPRSRVKIESCIASVFT